MYGSVSINALEDQWVLMDDREQIVEDILKWHRIDYKSIEHRVDDVLEVRMILFSKIHWYKVQAVAHAYMEDVFLLDTAQKNGERKVERVVYTYDATDEAGKWIVTEEPGGVLRQTEWADGDTYVGQTANGFNRFRIYGA